MEIQNKLGKAVVYARVSSDGSQDSNISIEFQIETACQYCLSNKINILGIYIDRNISGVEENRSQFLKMVQRIKDEPLDYVIVSGADRITRSMTTFYLFNQVLKAKKIKLISTRTFFSSQPELSENVMLANCLKTVKAFDSRVNKKKHD
ncbi:recombinase family protein [Patescibacteria group bacterium]|nr:recombinase family protein [Patescibacteria group bacterium]